MKKIIRNLVGKMMKKREMIDANFVVDLLTYVWFLRPVSSFRSMSFLELQRLVRPRNQEYQD